MSTLQFHFDFASPNAYLAHLAIPQIEAKTGVKFEYVPILLGGVFKATNNAPPMVSLQGIKNKPEYMQIETKRFLKQYDLAPYNHNAHFPVNTLKIMRGVIVAQQNGYFEKYIDAIYASMWRDGKNMADLDIIESVFKAAGLPAEEILEGMQDPAIKQRLISNTEESVSKGTFGIPTFFLNDEIYFGKDHLKDLVDEL